MQKCDNTTIEYTGQYCVLSYSTYTKASSPMLWVDLKWDMQSHLFSET